MEFILKKDGSDKTTISLKDLIKMLNIGSLEKKIKSLESRIEELEKVPVLNKKDILSLINSTIVKKGEVINISSNASIEKLKSTKVGDIYYNATKKCIRLKTDNGWITLNV